MKYNFTLIIPTHNGHNYLKRSIEYFKKLKVDVFYCDSSESPFKGYVYPNIHYLHFPGKKFPEKVLLTLRKVKTDFVALCADDDFILIPSLYEGFRVLQGNKAFKTVVGKYIFFYEKFDGNFYSLNKDFPKDINSSPKKNAEQFFKNYYQILWAMYDKEILIKSFTIIKNANFENDNFIELTIGAIACSLGGIKFMNVIWGIRERSENDHWGKRHKGINNYYQEKRIRRDFVLFKKGIDKETYKGYSELVLQSYLNLNLINIIKLRFKAIGKILIPIWLINFFKKNSIPENNSINIEITKISFSDLLKINNIKEVLSSYVKTY